MQTFDELIQSDGAVEYATVALGKATQRIASITADDLIEWQELRETPAGKKVSGAVLILKSLVNDDGQRIGVTTPYAQMSDEEKGRVAATKKLKVRTSEALLKAIFELNGMTPKAEGIAKND